MSIVFLIYADRVQKRKHSRIREEGTRETDDISIIIIIMVNDARSLERWRSPRILLFIINGLFSLSRSCPAGNLCLNWIWIENYLDTWFTRSLPAHTASLMLFYYRKNAMRVKNTCVFFTVSSFLDLIYILWGISLYLCYIFYLFLLPLPLPSLLLLLLPLLLLRCSFIHFGMPSHWTRSYVLNFFSVYFLFPVYFKLSFVAVFRVFGSFKVRFGACAFSFRSLPLSISCSANCSKHV